MALGGACTAKAGCVPPAAGCPPRAQSPVRAPPCEPVTPSRAEGRASPAPPASPGRLLSHPAPVLRHSKRALAASDPGERLGGRVDLVVVPAGGEERELAQIFAEPGRLAAQ